MQGFLNAFLKKILDWGLIQNKRKIYFWYLVNYIFYITILQCIFTKEKNVIAEIWNIMEQI